MPKPPTAVQRTIEKARGHKDVIRSRAERTLVWNVWERLLEIEFVDRSVALAGKAFVSFFPLVIVVAAFVPSELRHSIFSTLTHRLGVTGHALVTAKQAFASSQDIRRATGVLGLVLTFFFATSFTTALQRVYLRAWRRPPGGSLGTYVRGPVWLAAVVAYMALLGWARSLLSGDTGVAVFVVFALVASAATWALTAWLMLMGQVRLRVLIPSGILTGIAMSGYAYSATIWMPNNVTNNEHQFGLFGVALSLVTWFSGAAICIMVGACAGPVLAEDSGSVGRLARFGADSLLVPDASPSLPPPTRTLRLADAFTPLDEDSLSPKEVR